MKIHYKNEIIEFKNNINIYDIKNMIYKKYGVSHCHQFIFVDGKYYNIAGYHVRHIWPIKKNLNK